MSDKIFREMAEQMKPSDELVEGLLAKLDDPPVAEPDSDPEPIAAKSAARDRKPLLWLSAAACLVVVSGFVAVALRGIQPPVVAAGVDPQTSQAGAPAEVAAPAESSIPLVTAAASEYADIYQAVTQLSVNRNRAVLDAGSIPESAPVPASSEAGAAAGIEDSASYKYRLESGTGTNVQVADIDEGDVVKTDGRAIYVAKDNTVSIVGAAGSASANLAKIDISDHIDKIPVDKDGLALRPPGTITDLMLHQNTLVVLYQAYTQGEADFSGSETYVPFLASELQTLLYDVSDLNNPRYLMTYEQSGSYTTSRLSDGVLYLISNHQIADTGKIDADQPSTFVPETGDNGARQVMLPADVKVMPEPTTPSYAVVTALDVAASTRLGELSVLGGAETVYMSAENLYLAAGTYAEYVQKNTRTAPVYVPETTHLIKVALNSGAVKVAAEADISGRLLNQFALDEYDSHLRLATQTTTESGQSVSSLRVLDDQMKVVGKIDDLAPGETIESVRFSEKVGYLVTYLQVDPLFTVDLSDPANPKVLSQLKIPGFSTYLHPWSDGLLLGFGSSGDDGTLKLSMFDVSDPFHVTEVTSAKVDPSNYDSEALTNHHAIWVNPELDLIGFPTTDWNWTIDSNGVAHTPQSYWIFKYSDGGFEKVKELELPDADQTMARAILVRDHLYVATRSAVTAYTLDDFAKAAQVTLD